MTAPQAVSMWVAKDKAGIVVETSPTVPGLIALLVATYGGGVQRTDGLRVIFGTGEIFTIDAWVGREGLTPR